ncbi:hypothetical protein ED312_23270 [Sinomicrobium pectinilyticum]|uniref:Thiopeptide-type bacteriocin biosynthesis domain-containing protein n=1 Tax=Sinomicrobium pectinilyticum TaxID=1084421 RepID=A0A3N0CZG2_SINP1|nr:thiopeptide-type bacteriocin biosynthesis protein [Sinomicrobium pectinilyticum]RNL68586.1 hypothetical protein ED312_23270 [Sinomicrobium pectinilyticum]
MMPKNGVVRNFLPGENWLYYKIYTGPRTSDYILTQIIKPFVSDLIREKIIDKWFFIRYSDPKYHLRIRFYSSKVSNISLIINRLTPLLKDLIGYEQVWKVQMDTYTRELERYGVYTIDRSETLFFHESQMILSFLAMIDEGEGQELRWLFALKVVDNLLSCFNYSLNEKLDLLTRMKSGFAKEHGINRALKKQLDDKYRLKRGDIEYFMTLQEEGNHRYKEILELLKIKREKSELYISKILEYKEKDRLDVLLDGLMTSYIHMFMNRLFMSKNRVHEMVCYDFLYRYYSSEVAKEKCERKVSV